MYRRRYCPSTNPEPEENVSRRTVQRRAAQRQLLTQAPLRLYCWKVGRPLRPVGASRCRLRTEGRGVSKSWDKFGAVDTFRHKLVAPQAPSLVLFASRLP